MEFRVISPTTAVLSTEPVELYTLKGNENTCIGKNICLNISLTPDEAKDIGKELLEFGEKYS